MVVNVWVKSGYAASVAFLTSIISTLEAGELSGLGLLIAATAALVAGGGVLGLGNVKDPGGLQLGAEKAAQDAGTFTVVPNS